MNQRFNYYKFVDDYVQAFVPREFGRHLAHASAHCSLLICLRLLATAGTMPSALAPYLCSFLLVSIASLRRELRQANKTIRSHEAAYRRGYAKISDHEYDQMAAAREKLKAQLRVVAAHAPELEEEEQSIALLSLDNQPLEYWYSTLPVATPMIVQPKIDGCSLGLRYVDGELDPCIEALRL